MRMPLNNSLLQEGASHMGNNLVEVTNDRCQGSCTWWSYLNTCLEGSLWVGFTPHLLKEV